MDKKLIDNYARLIAVSGGAVQKGQEVHIQASTEIADFAALVAKHCYECGASRVIVEWENEELQKLGYQYADEEKLSSLNEADIGMQNYLNARLPVMIYLESDDPDGLSGVDGGKLSRVLKARKLAIKPYRAQRENRYQWCIAGVPGKAWARKVFPDLKEEEAVEALWTAILKVARAYEGDPVENWKKHEANLKEKKAKLNALNLRKLVYKSSNGTDFEVGLIPGVIFEAGGEYTRGGKTMFEPNIPSEECFTSPMKGEAEGIVYSTKPLSYNGTLIEDFSVRFHKGQAVEVKAKKGQEALESILHIDEGSSYLGECALVPFDSPINQSGILFFNTLYDENAACHLALGRGFETLYPGYDELGDDEVHKRGMNTSTSHVDFMIGSRDLSITGIDKGGKEIPIFVNGNWAI